MKRYLFASTCVFLLSIVPQIHGDMVLYFSFDAIKGDTVEDLSEFGNDGTL